MVQGLGSGSWTRPETQRTRPGGPESGLTSTENVIIKLLLAILGSVRWGLYDMTLTYGAYYHLDRGIRDK